MSVSAHMLVNDVDRHEGFDMIKMQIDGADGLDGSLELSVSDPDLVGSFQPGATYDLTLDLTLAAQESDGDAATSDDTDADASDVDTDASADDTADTDSASSATSSSDDTAAAE